MANSNNGSDETNSSLPAIAGPIIPPVDPTSGAANAPTPNPALGAASALTPALGQTAGPVAMNLLFCEQLCQFILETINSTSVVLKLAEQSPLPIWKEQKTRKPRRRRIVSCWSTIGSIHNY
ncbi:UNVERIFIED_CONTAM: hypothetical protein Slati_1146500 [Sesamum latifolium]|uniref:Uncharacterized protein n=1 Tax=Sesamum latifolium TaxID=2727402 RepID=A0AAW2XC73_9LAMI